MTVIYYDFSNVPVGTRVHDLSQFEKVRTNSPVVVEYAGRKAMRSHLTFAQREPKGGERCEVQLRGSRLGNPDESMWYGMSVFLPGDHATDGIWELVSQWYPEADHDDEIGRQPALSLHTADGKWLLTGKTSPEVNTPINHPSIKTYKVFEFDSFGDRGKWTDWVFCIVWSHRDNGRVRAWKNGELVADYNGPTGYNDQKVPSWKNGIYKGWQQMGRIDAVAERTVYHSEMRVGDKNASYADVDPRPVVSPTPVPTPDPEVPALKARISELEALLEDTQRTLTETEAARAEAQGRLNRAQARLAALLV